MPRSMLKDPDQEISSKIFGTGVMQANVAALGRKIKIPPTTLHGWKKKPQFMTLYGFAKIAREVGMSDEQMLGIIKCIR